MDLSTFLGSCPPDPSAVGGWARCETCDSPMRSDGLGCTGPTRHATPTTVRLYATWTGTRQNLHAMHENGIRLIVGPDQLRRMRGQPPLAYALDNGAYGCWTRVTAFDTGGFTTAVRRWGAGADFIVVPDLVAGGRGSLAMSLRWLPWLRDNVPGQALYLAVQDGMEPGDFLEAADGTEGLYLPTGERFDGLFIGGTTEWKERTMHAWGALADRCGVRMHVGRVNSARRIHLAVDAGAASVDGTSVTRFSVNAAPLASAAREARHPGLFDLR